MLIYEKFQVRGAFRAVLYGPDGQVLRERTGSNLVVTAGKDLIAEIFEQAVTGTRPSHIAVGTSNAATAIGQTALQGTELARQAFAGGFPSRAANVITYKSSFAAGVGTGTIEEAGVFNANALGTMVSRFLTGTFTKGAGDILDVTWALTFG